jgi:hypothetical protein
MYILSQNRKLLNDIRDIEIDENHTTYIVGNSITGESITLGKYETENEAIFVLGKIFEHIAFDPSKPYKMPPNAIGNKYKFVNDPDWLPSLLSKEVEIL